MSKLWFWVGSKIRVPIRPLPNGRGNACQVLTQIDLVITADAGMWTSFLIPKQPPLPCFSTNSWPIFKVPAWFWSLDLWEQDYRMKSFEHVWTMLDIIYCKSCQISHILQYKLFSWMFFYQ
jgi:hypothetical protein